MAGLAKTNDFMLSTATVMLGAAEDLYNLNPLDHSIGLVKNFTMTSEPAYTELTQGVKNTIVFSVLTSNPVRATMEVYEYTSRNLGYSLGLENAENLTALTIQTTTDAAVDGDVSPAEFDLPVTSGTGFVVGDYIMIKKDNLDDFVVRRIVGLTGSPVDTLVVDEALPDVPNGSVVLKVNAIGIGSKTEQPFYSAKVAGKLANGEEIVILIPKVRITRGFNLAFSSQDYANLPFEFTVYDLVNSDVFYSKFNGDQAQIIRQ